MPEVLMETKSMPKVLMDTKSMPQYLMHKQEYAWNALISISRDTGNLYVVFLRKSQHL